MALRVPSSQRSNKLRRLVAEERRLLSEKAALEMMLKNIQTQRTKLRLEQIQLCSHLQTELGEEYVEVPVKAAPSPDPLDMEEEENNLFVNRPALHLDVTNFQNSFFRRDAENEEEEDEDSEEEIGCAKEVLGNLEENEIDFENF